MRHEHPGCALRELMQIGKASFGADGVLHHRSCTCTLRRNTPGSPVDCHRSKKAETSGLSWPPSGPLSPGAALAASRGDAPRRLRPPPLAASRHHGGLTPPLAAATGARGTGALLAAATRAQSTRQPSRGAPAAPLGCAPAGGRFKSLQRRAHRARQSLPTGRVALPATPRAALGSRPPRAAPHPGLPPAQALPPVLRDARRRAPARPRPPPSPYASDRVIPSPRPARPPASRRRS